MKKGIVRLLAALIVCAVVAGIGAFIFLDQIVQRGVETVGPSVAKVSVSVRSAGISLFSGRGKLKDLEIGNPPGFATPFAIKAGLVEVQVEPASVLADKVVVKSVRVEAPEITYEAGAGGSNLGKILENVNGDASASTNKTAARKLQVDDFVVTGGKVNVSATLLGGKSVVVPLPEIHFTNLGQGPEGITAADLTEKILTQVLEAATKAAISAAGDLTKGLGEGMKNMSGPAAEQAGKATKALGDLLKKTK